VVKNEVLKKLSVAKEAQKEISIEVKSTQLMIAELDSRINAAKSLNKELTDSISSKTKLLDTEKRYTETTKKQMENMEVTIINTKESNAKMSVDISELSQTLRNIMNENTQIAANKGSLENQLTEFKRTIAAEMEIIKKHEKELALATKKMDDMNNKKRDVSATFENINKSISNSIEETKRISNDITNQDGALNEVDSTLTKTRERHAQVKKNLAEKQKELLEFKQNMNQDIELLQRVEKQIADELQTNEATIRKYTKLQTSLNELTASTNKHAMLMQSLENEKEDLTKQTTAESIILEETKNSLNIVKVEYNSLIMSKKIVTTELFEAKSKMAKEIEQISAMEKSIKDTNTQIEFENKRYNDMSSKYALSLKKFNSRKDDISKVIENMTILDDELNLHNMDNIVHDTDDVPAGLEEFTNNDIKIYILCHNEQCFNEAPRIYGKYSWAVPILMTYQDITFENAFWKQLYEIRGDWYNCKMVGTLSFRASKKINLSIIDNIIRDPSKWTSGYYHFLSKDIPVNNKQHPNLVTILSDVTRSLRLDMPNENCCNYWMCSPDKMLRFLIWFEEDAFPLVMSHQLSMTNSTYIGTLKRDDLLKLGPYPFYTHAPFVFERLFISYFKKICRTKD
jgi:chromosome segregation ATPase